MMHWRFGIVLAGACLCATALHAQRVADPSAFSELRIDGNGLAELDRTIGSGFEGQSAAAALTWIAQTARLNLTFDPHLANLATRLSIPPHDRTAAAALLEVARASQITVRVSASGQLIVAAAPASVISKSSARDSVARPAVELPAVRTEEVREERRQFETTSRIGGVSITGAEVRSTPSFVEPDVLRAVQLLPGIESRSDWSAGFNVRGGEADQNLVLLDGYPILDPFHMGGVFSTFIGSTVGRVDLRTGGMPVQYDGRLSGSLDVRSAEPLSSTPHGTAEVSLVSSSASVGKAFADGDGSWIVAARRTYADAIVNLFKPDGFPYHFQDIHGHLTHTLGAHARFSVTAYDGLDIAAGGDPTPTTSSWGNSVVGATIAKTIDNRPHLFGRVIGDSITLEQRASITRFAGHVDVPSEIIHVSNGVTDMRISGDATAHGTRLTQVLGYELSRQVASYHAGAAYPLFGDLLPFDSLRSTSRAASVYVDELWRARQNLLIEGGLRLDDVQPTKWVGLLPRLSVKYLLSPRTAITAGGGSYAQWMHSVGNEEEPVRPLQFWVTSDAATPVSRARDATLGIEHWLSTSRLLHVEGFAKRYTSLLTSNPASDPRVANDEFNQVTGSSYGADVLLRQLETPGGQFSGWMSYSYAFNTRIQPNGVRYYPVQDRRHNLNLVGSWHVDAYTWGVRFNIGSGIPTTPVLGQFLRDRYDPATGRWVGNVGGENEQNIPAGYNSARLPYYSRADVSINRAGRLFGLAVSPYLSVVNVFNAHNPAGYFYTFTKYNGQGDRSSFPNLPFAPTFGVTVGY